MFGELALIYNQRRLATVICMSETEMCTMDSVRFNKILGVLQRQEDQKKNEFIEKEILKDKEFSSLAHVIGVNFVKRVMPKNKVIFRQGDLPEKVYLIYSGQVKLVKESEISREYDICAKKRSLPTVSSLERGKSVQLAEDQKPVRIEFALLGNGQMMGEEGLFSGDLRGYTAVIDSEAVLYEIDNERFLVVCKNNVTVQILMNRLIEKKLRNLDLLIMRALKVKTKALGSDWQSSPLKKSGTQEQPPEADPPHKSSRSANPPAKSGTRLATEEPPVNWGIKKMLTRTKLEIPRKSKIQEHFELVHASRTIHQRLRRSTEDTKEELKKTETDRGAPKKRTILTSKAALLEVLDKPSPGLAYLRSSRPSNDKKGYIFTTNPHTFRMELVRTMIRKKTEHTVCLRETSREFGDHTSNNLDLIKPSSHARSSSIGAAQPHKISAFSPYPDLSAPEHSKASRIMTEAHTRNNSSAGPDQLSAMSSFSIKQLRSPTIFQKNLQSSLTLLQK